MAIIKDEKKRNEIVGLLTQAYWMEIETVMSYIANSVNLDGVRAQEIKKSLQADITEELGHAQQYGRRIKELYGLVPGSQQFKASQTFLQPPQDTTDVTAVTMPDIGHYLAMEAPERLAEALISFYRHVDHAE